VKFGYVITTCPYSSYEGFNLMSTVISYVLYSVTFKIRNIYQTCNRYLPILYILHKNWSQKRRSL